MRSRYLIWCSRIVPQIARPGAAARSSVTNAKNAVARGIRPVAVDLQLVRGHAEELQAPAHLVPGLLREPRGGVLEHVLAHEHDRDDLDAGRHACALGDGELAEERASVPDVEHPHVEARDLRIADRLLLDGRQRERGAPEVERALRPRSVRTGFTRARTAAERSRDEREQEPPDHRADCRRSHAMFNGEPPAVIAARAYTHAMSRLALITVAIVTACGSSSPPPPVVANTAPAHTAAPAPDAAPLDPYQRAMQGLSGFADQMCACPDPACAQAVSATMTTWATDQATSANDLKPTDAQAKDLQVVVQRLTECMMKAMGSSPMTPPDAGP